MTFFPLIVLLAWIPVGLALCLRFPMRIALLIIFIGGWAILPVANYTPQPDAFPYWILGTNFPTDYFFTKASIIGLTGLLGLLIFDRKAIRGFELTLWDIPMLIWGIVPLLSSIANAIPPGTLVASEIYQFLAWVVPYFLGRLYFSDTASLRLAARAFVIAGLLYIPICLFEVWKGPQLYTHIYGYQPFQWIGAKRYFGYRPVGFLENGNQLGIWMTTATLIATWLWFKRIVARVMNLPIAAVALSLLFTTLLCQSIGSILLLLLLLPFVFFSHRTFPRAVALLMICGILFSAGLRIANVISLRSLVHNNPQAHEVATFLKKIGRGSLGWRLVEDERQVSIAIKKPILGYGEWNWWRRGLYRPWSLWLLAFGMYGGIGLLALEALQMVPVIRVVWFPLARSDIESVNLRHALAASILMSALDNLLNASMILPLLLVVGGMIRWKSAATEVHVTVEKHPEIVRPEIV